MPRFGLIGHPVAHSLSPLLFRQAYGGRWEYDLIDETDFGKAWERFEAGYQAVNVTAPHKTEALRRATVIPDHVRRTGACNILVKTPEGVTAHNSDYLAVKNLLEDASSWSERLTNALPRAHGGERDGACGASDVGSSGAAGVAKRIRGQSPLKPKPTILIVGFGGAGRAAAAAARDEGMDVVICNRTTDRADGIRPLEEVGMISAVCDVVIYTLPCAIPRMEEISCPVLIEANYRDPVLSGHSGIGRYIGGREWLLRQAVLGYALMTGEQPDQRAMSLDHTGTTI